MTTTAPKISRYEQAVLNNVNELAERIAEASDDAERLELTAKRDSLMSPPFDSGDTLRCDNDPRIWQVTTHNPTDGRRLSLVAVGVKDPKFADDTRRMNWPANRCTAA